MRATVRDIDKGWLLFSKMMKDLSSGAKVFVGVRGAEHVIRAHVNEFGAPSVGIPERSFLRSTFDANTEKYQRQIRRVLERAIGTTGPRKMRIVRTGLAAWGARVSADVKDTITAFNDPANAPSTIEKKGFDDPLIETRSMLNHVGYKVHVGGVEGEEL